MHVKLAKDAIEKYIETEKTMPVPENLPPEFYKKKGGVFVSIHKGKELRGCIGTYLPARKNLAEEIIANAVAACSRDSRFSPMAPEELPELTVEVNLLSEPKKISSLKELDPKKYGVIVKRGDGKCGLLLPGLEGVDSADQQISIACRKAGINPCSKEDTEIYKFAVQKFS